MNETDPSNATAAIVTPEASPDAAHDVTPDAALAPTVAMLAAVFAVALPGNGLVLWAYGGRARRGALAATQVGVVVRRRRLVFSSLPSVYFVLDRLNLFLFTYHS